MKNVKVLFVCLGNICRSPLAEAIFKHQITSKGLDHLIQVDSCGTANYHVGDLPDVRTRANAERNGVSMNHHGRQISNHDLEKFDYILAMDQGNYQNIMKMKNAKTHSHKIMLMRKFDPISGHEEVPDPYYGGENDFQEVFDILDRSIHCFIQHLEEEHLKA